MLAAPARASCADSVGVAVSAHNKENCTTVSLSERSRLLLGIVRYPVVRFRVPLHGWSLSSADKVQSDQVAPMNGTTTAVQQLQTSACAMALPERTASEELAA